MLLPILSFAEDEKTLSAVSVNAVNHPLAIAAIVSFLFLVLSTSNDRGFY